MKLDDIADLLEQIKGATFVNIDAETTPKAGVRCVITGVSAMLFTNKKGSAYEKIVQRRLKEAGKNPDDFVLSDLLWGTRIPNSPLIEHKGKYYLQCVILRQGEFVYYVGRNTIDPLSYGIRPSKPNQGLSEAAAVIVNTYALESITRISMMNETVLGQTRRELLKIIH